MNSFKEKIRQFMIGRYGIDEFGRDLQYLVMILVLLSFFTHNRLFHLLVWGCIIYTYYRMFSKDIQKRIQENNKYVEKKKKFLSSFSGKDSKVKIYKCPVCGQKVRVPKGKGKISIHCPKCNNDFIKRT